MSPTTDLNPRQRAARRALDDLGSSRDDHTLLRVRCGRSHHVATVFGTAAGAVFESRVGSHAHGRRDFTDEAHHTARHGTCFVDLLNGDPYTEDLVPAACECGSWELSRTRLQKAIDTHQRTLRLR